MDTRHSHLRNTSRRAKSAVGTAGKPSLIVTVMLVCCGALVVANGTEQVDSGWSLATRPSITTDQRPADPRQQVIMQDVLHRLQLPLLQVPPAAQTPNNTSGGTAKTGGTSQGSLR